MVEIRGAGTSGGGQATFTGGDGSTRAGIIRGY